MLTATYALVSLSVEQASIRVSLLAFQQYMHAQLRHAQLRQQHERNLAHVQYAGEWLNRFYQSGYWRKVDQYLIPAICQATPHADGLLDELKKLNHSALESVNTVKRHAQAAVDSQEQQIDLLRLAIDGFCAALMARLEKEERELFALARRVIGGEAWFALAHQFLAQDADREERRRSKGQLLAFTLPVAPAIAANSATGERRAHHHVA